MPKGWDGIISQLINRRISRPTARYLSKHTNITPNQVTIISFVTCVLSGLSFFYFQPIIGGILAQMSSILDGVDGDLAVLTNRITKFGGFLDSILDRFGDAIILLGMGYYAYMVFPVWSVVAVTVIALTGTIMVSYSRAKAEDVGITFKSGVTGLAANRDVRLFIIMIGSILGQVLATLIILAGLTNIVVAARLYVVFKTLKNAEGQD